MCTSCNLILLQPPPLCWNTYLALLKVTPDFSKFSPVCPSFKNMAPPTLKKHCSVSWWSRVKLADQQSFPLIQQSLFSLLSTSYWFPSIRLSSSNLPFSLESLPHSLLLWSLFLYACVTISSLSIVSPISDIYQPFRKPCRAQRSSARGWKCDPNLKSWIGLLSSTEGPLKLVVEWEINTGLGRGMMGCEGKPDGGTYQERFVVGCEWEMNIFISCYLLAVCVFGFFLIQDLNPNRFQKSAAFFPSKQLNGGVLIWRASFVKTCELCKCDMINDFIKGFAQSKLQHKTGKVIDWYETDTFNDRAHWDFLVLT